MGKIGVLKSMNCMIVNSKESLYFRKQLKPNQFFCFSYLTQIVRYIRGEHKVALTVTFSNASLKNDTIKIITIVLQNISVNFLFCNLFLTKNAVEGKSLDSPV